MAKDRAEWPESASDIAEITRGWDATYGDRKNELVVMGAKMSHAATRAELEAALVTDEEFAGGQSLWDEFDDPFPEWEEAEEEDGEDEDGDGDEEWEDVDDDEEDDDDDDEEAK